MDNIGMIVGLVARRTGTFGGGLFAISRVPTSIKSGLMIGSMTTSSISGGDKGPWLAKLDLGGDR